MGTKRRLSRQQQQEYRSRDQLADRFDEYGWIPDPISRDLGEDFIVRIYNEGISTGLAFFVQLKSTDDLDRLEIKGGYTSYPLKVKDLIHWDSSAPPVFVIIWDVNRLTGCWTSVHDAIAELDKRKSNWRNQKKVRVRIPRSNGTDDEGMCRIRQCVAYYCYPIVSKGRDVEIHATFTFPDTPEGQASRVALERHLAAGDVAEIDGEFIRELEFSDWWTRLFGEMDPSTGRLILGSRPSEQSVPVRLDLIPPDGDGYVFPYADFMVIKQGFDEFTVSNEHQPVALHFQFVFKRSEQHFTASVKLNGPGANVQETRDVLQFLKALAKGGKMRMTFRRTGKVLDGFLPGGVVDPPNPDFVDLIDTLCLIQQKTGRSLALRPDWAVSHRDVVRAREIVVIFETGRIAYGDATVTGRFQKEALELMLEAYQSGRPIKFRITSDETHVELLGVKISLGPVTRYISGEIGTPTVGLESTVSRMEAEDDLEVNLVNAEVIEEFANWVPKAKKNLKTD